MKRTFRVLSSTLAISWSALAFHTAPSSADTIIDPVSATTNMGALFALANSINQSGLSLGYTSGVTNFDTYLAAGPTHSSAPGNDWVTIDATTGHVDFDLGAVFSINRAAVWNAGCSTCDNAFAVQDVNLLASLDAAFSSPVLLGSYTLTHSLTTGVLAQVVSFAPTSAKFIRMQILSNYGSADGVALGEVAFAVPEPAPLTLLGLGLAGLALVPRRSA